MKILTVALLASNIALADPQESYFDTGAGVLFAITNEPCTIFNAKDIAEFKLKYAYGVDTNNSDRRDGCYLIENGDVEIELEYQNEFITIPKIPLDQFKGKE